MTCAVVTGDYAPEDDVAKPVGDSDTSLFVPSQTSMAIRRGMHFVTDRRPRACSAVTTKLLADEKAKEGGIRDFYSPLAFVSTDEGGAPGSNVSGRPRDSVDCIR